jgi:hypothetical protein
MSLEIQEPVNIELEIKMYLAQKLKEKMEHKKELTRERVRRWNDRRRNKSETVSNITTIDQLIKSQNKRGRPHKEINIMDLLPLIRI